MEQSPAADQFFEMYSATFSREPSSISEERKDGIARNPLRTMERM
jgi:hypothetical protein